MKKNIISGFLGAILSIGLFLLAYYYIDEVLVNKFLPRNKTEAIIYFPMIIIGPVLALAIHELGHLLTGLFLGQKLKIFVVAFLGLKEKEGKIKFFFNNNLSLFGGIAATVPKSKEEINPNDYAKILIAGPIASLLYSLICFLLFYQYDTYLNSFFVLTALTSLGIFLATTLPEKSGIMFTDRKRFQRLVTSGITQDSEIAMYELLANSIIDDSFKYIDISKTLILEKDKDNTIQFWMHYLRYMHYKENGQKDELNKAYEKLISIKPQIPKSIWNSLKVD